MQIKNQLPYLFLCLLLSSGLYAQDTFSKGGFLIGSTLGFSYASSNVEITTNGTTEKGTDSKASQLTFAPNLAYFLTDNFALGLGMEYTFNRVSEPINIADPDAGIQKDFDSDLLFGPIARYYFPTGDDQAFFGVLTMGFGSSQDKINFQGSQQSISTNVFAVGVGPGFTIISNGFIGIEAIAKYNFARSSYDINNGSNSSSTVSWTNQVDLSLGIQFYLGRVGPAGNTGGNRGTDDKPRRDYF